MSQLLNATITVGEFFGVVYGYNSSGVGSISSGTQANGPTVRECQWNSNNGGFLQFAYTTNVNNGKFGRIVIGTTSYFRTAGEFILNGGTSSNGVTNNSGLPVWIWPSVPNNFGTTAGALVNFDVFYEDPDTTVSVVAPATIGADDDRFGVTVNGIGVAGENRYGVGLNATDTSDLTGTTPSVAITGQTGAPSVSFEVTTELPTLGQTRTYYLYALRTELTGGAGGANNEGAAAWIYTGDSFQVTRTNTPSTLPSEDPVLEPYGLAINDDAGNLLTSFSTEVMLNRVFSTTVASLSTTGDTTITGVPTSVTNSNSIITVDLNTSTGTSVAPPAHISSSGTITIARSLSSLGARVNALQYRDIPPTGYGLFVRNGLDEGIINENTVTYGVTEVHTIDPTLTTLTPNVIPGTEVSRTITGLTLTGNYPIGQTPPLVAIKSTHGDWIIKPFLYSTNGTTYNRLYIFLPTTFTSGTEWTVAICVTSDVLTPAVYGNTDYGLEVKNGSGLTTWSSNWKQAIISHVQNANVFTTGVTQDGLYDVESGADGVTAPAATTSDIYAQLISNGQTVSVTTRQMDPANTFISFSGCQGRVRYNGGVKTLDGVFQYNAGGGTHYPAARIDSATSASLQMFRVADFNPAGVSDGIRITDSNHPSGFIAFIRIPGI
jgi:hypothetical protein